jgi:uncharacterized membrane protein
MQDASRAFEVAGVAILIVGSLLALVSYAMELRRSSASRAYEVLRRNLGRAILLGLEVLIIADIIRTITVDPTVANAATLGVIVLVRTFLSFSLEIELDGTLPWRRARTDRD